VDDASPILFARQSVRNVTWPAADVAARSLSAAGLDIIAVVTDGSPSAIERARTVLDNAYPVPDGPQTIGEFELIGSSSSLTSAYQQLADVVILTSLAIAGCTLATSIAAGLADRKRPFSMLRLAGARLATLRGVVVLESAVPLLAVAIVAIGAGFGASAIFASAQLRHPLVAPGAGYYLVTAGGLAASLAIIAATFPLLRLITGPEVARNE
jgi:ABC-type antimicrobial peptide transport system permease subunit